MNCHCQFLEPAFWHDGPCYVMHNTCSRDGGHTELEQWVMGQNYLKNHVLFQTSGSSGAAKWVALSKSALIASGREVNKSLGIETGAHWGLALPIHHVGGFGVLVRSFLSGCHCHVFHQKWSPMAFTRFVYEHKCECLSLVPTQVADLISSSCIAPCCVKMVVVGGGSLSDEQYKKAKALGWPILRSYGMTEAASQIATGDLADGYLRILNGWETRVDASGVLQWRGAAGFSGYVIEEDCAFSFIDPKVDGWFTTQDLVELDGDGIRVLGRTDSLVKVLGELVDTTSIERRIEQQTSCRAIVLTIADARRGMKLIAVLESSNAIELKGFRGVETLGEVHTLCAFPRSALGKIQRASIRAKLGL